MFSSSSSTRIEQLNKIIHQGFYSVCVYMCIIALDCTYSSISDVGMHQEKHDTMANSLY